MTLSQVVDGVTDLDSALFNPIITEVNSLRTSVDLADNAAVGIVNVMDHGAVADGATSDNAAFAAAISAMSAGDTLLIPPGTYAVASGVSFSKAMTVRGYGATISGKTVSAGATDVKVYGLASLNSTSYGFYTKYSRTSFIDCKVTDSASIGIFAETPSSASADIADIEIRGCTVDRSALSASSISEGGIKVHGYTTAPYQVKGNRIIGNVVRMPTSPTAGAAICIEVWGGAPYSAITGNTTFGGYMGVSMDTSNGTACTGNVCYGASSVGIELAASAKSVVSGNSIYGNALTSKGVVCSNTDPDNNVITGNLIANVTSRAIQVQGAENVAVTGNTVAGQTDGYGVEVKSSDGVTVSGNVLVGVGTGLKAIVIDTSSSVAIGTNLMKDWTQHGILLYGASAVTLDYITITGNVIDNCNVSYGTSLSGGAALGTHVYVYVPANASTYSASNVTTDRTYDADSTSTDELADVLGTLIADLRSAGLVK